MNGWYPIGHKLADTFIYIGFIHDYEYVIKVENDLICDLKHKTNMLFDKINVRVVVHGQKELWAHVY